MLLMCGIMSVPQKQAKGRHEAHDAMHNLGLCFLSSGLALGRTPEVEKVINTGVNVQTHHLDIFSKVLNLTL